METPPRRQMKTRRGPTFTQREQFVAEIIHQLFGRGKSFAFLTHLTKLEYYRKARLLLTVLKTRDDEELKKMLRESSNEVDDGQIPNRR